MVLEDFINELADRLDVKNLSDVAVRALMVRKINEGGKEVGRAAEWDCLKVHGQFNCVTNHKTGTVTIMNGSRTVTGSGTAWTNAMVGRYFKSSGSNWYRIIRFVSDSELTLETPITESSATGLSHIVWKRFYNLPSLIRRAKIVGKWVGDERIEQRSENYIIDRSPQMTEGEPTDASDGGISMFESSYSTGTVSLVQNDNVLTGYGTAWLDNVEPGDRLTVGANTYRVKRVESDTRIVMENYAKATISVSLSQTYSAEKDTPIQFQLYPVPDSGYVIPFVGYRRIFDLVNEKKDRFPYPEDFDVAVLDAAEASRMRDLDDVKWVQKVAEFKGRILDLKASQVMSTRRIQQIAPDIARRGTY